MIRFENKVEIPSYILDSIKALLKSAVSVDLEVVIKPLTKKRSLDSNKYYWTLVDKLARLLGNSKPRQHNLLLRSYGALESIEGQLVLTPIPDTDEAEEAIIEAVTYHLRPTSQVKEGTDGRVYRTYSMLKGSSSFDTKEMSDLIKGTIEECRQIGIPESEIMTPREKEQLDKMYGLRF